MSDTPKILSIDIYHQEDKLFQTIILVLLFYNSVDLLMLSKKKQSILNAGNFWHQNDVKYSFDKELLTTTMLEFLLFISCSLTMVYLEGISGIEY